MGGVPGLIFRPGEAAAPPRIVYLHGGYYCFGSPRTHAGHVARLANLCGTTVFSADYRLAPEHPYPAALEDAVSAFKSVTAEAGSPPALAGDSAGGGLSLSTAIALRDSGGAAPPAIALISPWVDLTCTSPSIRLNASRDALLKPGYSERCALAYASGMDRSGPALSPLNADLEGLPPTLVHVAGDELLVDEGEALTERLAASGVEVEHRRFEGMWHDFHVHAGMLREADVAMAEIGEWLRGQLASQSAARA